MSEELYRATIEIVRTERPVRAIQEIVDHIIRVEGENSPSLDDAKKRLAEVAEPYKAACERFIAAYNAIYHTGATA